MNTWDQDFPQYPHIEINFEKKKHSENGLRFDILRRRRFCGIGIFLIIQLKTHGR